jgi:hypothetical protein
VGIALCIVSAAKEGGLIVVLVQFAEDEVKNAFLRAVIKGKIDDLVFRRDASDFQLLDKFVDYSFIHGGK